MDNWDWLNISWLDFNTINGYDFVHPIYLYGILLYPLILFIKEIYNRLFSQNLEVALLEKDVVFSFSSLLRFIPPIFIWLATCCFFLSLARPQRSNEKVEQWSEGIDIMLVLDISQSMQGKDFTPDRLGAAKKMAIDFIDGRFQDRIGLVVFSGEAYSKSPLTSDYDLLKEHIDEIDYSDIQVQGTAIGSALAVAINRLEESKAKSKVIILLSDGDNNAGNLDPISAAKLAYSFNMKVYTIGMGKDGKVPYEQKQNLFGITRTQTVYFENTLNEKDLRSIAKTSEGQYFRATNNAALSEIFKTIDDFEKSEIKEERFTIAKEYYHYYVYWGILFLLCWLLTKSSFLTNALED